MSRVGKRPIQIPQGVEVKISGDEIAVKGPRGELRDALPSQIKAEIKDGQIFIVPKYENKKAKALWGLYRALISNMVTGVNEGFEKKLQIEGVGYRAALEGDKLVLQLGFSHPVHIEKPEGISFSVEKNIVTVSGADKAKVGEWAAKIRAKRPPEPYKGKGVRYLGEIVRRKEGKKAVGAGK